MKYPLLFLLLTVSFVTKAQKSDYDAMISEGNDLLKRNRVPLAIEKYKDAVKLETTKVEGYYKLGLAYTAYYDGTGLFGDSALSFFNKVLLIDNDYGDVHFCLGRIKGKLHDFTGALSDLNYAIKKHPDTSGYTSRALIKYKLNDLDGACSDFDTSIKLGSKISKLILTNKLLDIKCNLVSIESNEALYNIKFIKAIQTTINKGNEIQVIFSITPKEIEDFPPVVSTKIVYALDNGPEKKVDLMHKEDNLNLTLYDKNIKEKAPELYDLIKDYIDLSTNQKMTILVFKFKNVDKPTVNEMTMVYGCWEKRNTNLRVEKKYEFKVEKR